MLLILLLLTPSVRSDRINLPPKLLEYAVRSQPAIRAECSTSGCPVEESVLGNGRCWGYEKNCSYENSYSAELGVPKCGRSGNRDRFFKQADFGYIRERNHMLDICSSADENHSRLRCSDELRYCYVHNIFFDFKSWEVKNSKRYREDVIQPGEVGGNCEVFHEKTLKDQMAERGYLRSWADEFKHFTTAPSFQVDYAHCDVIFERPTIVIKLDAAVNMYHHFCDFVNLYASQHINSSFSQQVDVLWWDTHSAGFVDPMFGDTWKAFSDSKPVELTALAGRRVCFRSAMFPLLARQMFGLFYNTPLEKECHGTGLMHAFSHHILHRLGVKQNGPVLDSVRVTILSRSTKFRRILNIEEICTQALEGLT
ncbi:hypothetical protein Q1695_005148 [Nippostrongylus brasiliensis]|nr:hypothetical protein Q1695_005148 [Nippostrongylus brasiliensis]